MTATARGTLPNVLWTPASNSGTSGIRSVSDRSVDQKVSGLAKAGAERPVKVRIRFRKERVIAFKQHDIDQANQQSEDKNGLEWMRGGHPICPAPIRNRLNCLRHERAFGPRECAFSTGGQSSDSGDGKPPMGSRDAFHGCCPCGRSAMHAYWPGGKFCFHSLAAGRRRSTPARHACRWPCAAGLGSCPSGRYSRPGRRPVAAVPYRRNAIVAMIAGVDGRLMIEQAIG